MNFYAELRKVDGQEYKPACLRVMRSSLDRLLEEKNCSVSIVSSDEFKESNKVLGGKARDLCNKGMGNHPNLHCRLRHRRRKFCGNMDS